MLKNVPALLICLLLSQSVHAYGPLAHEAFIDLAWKDELAPLLRDRFPDLTDEDLKTARKYAYGGSVMQDMGYYPFGNKLFTNLLHYVRSGDFIIALFEEAKDVNEYAFALGALSHYASDTTGHKLATNRVVPMLYPELRRKFGDEVTFAEKPSAHIKVEFGCDVIEIAKGNYASEAFHELIGFDIAEDSLERAFFKTYGLHIDDIFLDTGLTIGTFRYSVSQLIPELTKIAWEQKKDDILKLHPDLTEESFYFRISRSEYEKQWGNKYRKPGFCTRAIGFFIRIFQKIGLFKTLSIKALTPETEQMFVRSFKETTEEYRQLLKQLRFGKLILQNMDLDTGGNPEAGEYELADETYEELVEKLASNQFANISLDLSDNILSFYSNLNRSLNTKKQKKDARKLIESLSLLRTIRFKAAQTSQKRCMLELIS